MPKLILVPRGNLGNQMLQYMFATTLRRLVPDLEVAGYSMPMWGLDGGSLGRISNLVPSIRLQDPDLSSIARLYSVGLLKVAKFRGVPINYALLGQPEWYDGIFTREALVTHSCAADELLINVRGDEILGARHPDYGPLPIDFYSKLIAQTGLKPVFLGQLGDDYYSRLLFKCFPQAKFIPSQGALADFESIRRATHIVVSVSTFSWLAAWLSHATTVHLPMMGIFNPHQRPDIWLLPEGETRYRFYPMPVRKWVASEDQISSLSAPVELSPALPDDLAVLHRQVEATRQRPRRRAVRNLVVRSILSWPLLRG